MNKFYGEWDRNPSTMNKEAINIYLKLMVWKVWTVHQKWSWDDQLGERLNKLPEKHQILSNKKLFPAAVNKRYKN